MSSSKAENYSSPAAQADAEAHHQHPLLMSVSITDPLVLQRCYMPFFLRGGLFVPSARRFSLRQRLFLVLTLPALPDAPDKHTICALNTTVAWLSPAPWGAGQITNDQLGRGGVNARVQEVGLHFDNAEPDLKPFIESLLKALL
ncbi:hypothetical protein [Pseudohongiella acticola]|jgi:type IV pilus assembly protein PilZ|uniref:PilZ domain-containing protein n=1 Tax=Pseudohongiella acticola TaxID=1524254 RepID=UPI0030EBE3FC